MKFWGKKACLALVTCAAITVAGCGAIYKNHGYVPPEEDLNALVVGVDSRATVDDLIGPPSVAGMAGAGDYYYVRSKIREYGAFRPQVVERRIVAISFDEANTIANIEEFGLEDGQLVPLTRRVTTSTVVGKGFLRQLLGNIGQFGGADAFGGEL